MNTNKPRLFQDNSSRLVKTRRKSKQLKLVNSQKIKQPLRVNHLKCQEAPNIGAGFQNIHMLLQNHSIKLKTALQIT